MSGEVESIDVAIGVRDGKVVAQWKDPVREIVFDPPNSYKVGLALSRAALEAHKGAAGKDTVEFIAGELVEQKMTISDLARDMLIGQVATIVKTFIEQKKSPGYIAMHCVDTVLKETTR